MSANMSMSGVVASGSDCGGRIARDSRTKSVPTLNRTTVMNPARTAMILLNVSLFIFFRPSLEDCSEPRISQIKSTPEEHTDIDREQHSAEERGADSDLSSDGAAQISGQQDGADHRSTRNTIDDQTDEFDNPKGDSKLHGISELFECVRDRCDRYQMDHAVEKKEQGSKGAENTPRPDHFF